MLEGYLRCTNNVSIPAKKLIAFTLINLNFNMF